MGFVFEPISVLGGLFGLSRTLRPSQNRVPKKDLVLEGFKTQKSILFGSVLGGSARCHLPVICLGKTKRNPSINSEFILGFRLVFYRETKWSNVVLEIDFGFRFRTHFGARRTVWAFENVKTLPKQGPEKKPRFGRV